MRNLVSLGGKVKKKSGSLLDSDRYSFLSLDNAEPDFGVPSTDNSLLVSKTSGTRLFASIGDNLEYDSDSQSIRVASSVLDSARDAYFNSIFFDSAEVEPLPRRVFWDPDEDALAYATESGTTILTGQESVYNVRNNTASQINIGTPVMATGTIGNSGRITIAPMDGTNVENAKFFLGIAHTNIPADQDGKVVHFGKVRGVNLEAYSEGDVLWISTDSVGALTATEPTTGMKLPIAFVISNTSNGVMQVRATNGLRIRDLNDTVLTSLTDRDILTWDSASQNWINTSTPTLTSLTLDSAAALTGEVTSLSTVSQTQVASFSTATYGGGKFVIQAYDSAAGERHITEMLLTHNGDSAYATEYGTIYTGTDPLATFDVDVNAGNVRILATGASTNLTRYTVLEQLMLG